MSNLVQFVEFRPPPRLRLCLRRHRLRLRLRLLPHPPLRLRRGDIGYILEKTPKNEAWDNWKETDPDCYFVLWQREDTKYLMYEDEIKSVT